jgi:hypothetical protein
VLHSNSIIDDATLRLSLPEAGLSPAHLKCMWTRLLKEVQDPRELQKKPVRVSYEDRATLRRAS